MPKKKSAAKKPKQSKSDFVRSLAADTPAKEVVNKAKAAGITLTEDYTYKVRSLDNQRKAKGNKTGAGKSAKKAAPASVKARGRSPDKRNRVLELVGKNPSWSADQVAKAAGCSPAYVYSVWRKPKGSKTKRAEKITRSANGDAVTEFYRALKRVGVEQAKELIANVEAFQKA